MYNFDAVIDRRSTQSIKWQLYDDDVLPMWVADMDFLSPEPVTRAVQERVAHGVFGYEAAPAALREAIVAWLEARFKWIVSPDMLVFLPGVVPGFNMAVRAFVPPDEAVMVQTPVYFYILQAAEMAQRRSQMMTLTHRPGGYYEIDFDIFEEQAAAGSALFILCNPHNPVGRVFTPPELETMAEICLKHDVLICSDEIHGDLIFNEHAHVPIASLSPEIAARTITLMAPSKTFNIAGLQCAYAVIPDPELRKQFETTCRGIAHGANVLGYTAAQAAYQHGQAWLEAVLKYLEANRDLVAQTVIEHLPGVEMYKPEGTYLAWLDCRASGIQNPHQFFLEHARVALNDGASFGPGGEAFVRLNFGCPRSLLVEGLARMQRALAES